MIPSIGKAIGEVIVKNAVEKCLECVGTSGSENMQCLKRNLQLLSSRASDFKNQVESAEVSGKKKRKREVEDWLKEVEKLQPEVDNLEATGSCWRHPLGEDPVAKMLSQVKELYEQSNHFNELVLDAFGNIREPWSPTKLFGAKCKQNLERIWPCLVTDDISNIGIYGMGGVGKTTLAKHIEYHLLKITNYQVLWVTVSQDFSVNGLQDKIANVLGICLSDKDEEKERAKILRDTVMKKGNFVLILDDVWVEFSVERIGIPLGASKCRLVLTTRSLEVCNRMGCQRKFEVNTLDTNDSWDLFKYTLGLQSTELPADIEEIAKSVTQRCDGLPLGIITVAGSMRGVRDICEWRNTLEQLKACSEGHEMMERDVFPILEWSYSRLNDCQRHCFLYCCLYPEDEHVRREELIDLFIYAELMDRRSTRNLEFDQGHTILNHLIRVCLLEETKDKSGNKCVKMHDLIRDMALRITSGKNSLETTKGAPRFLVKRVGGRFSKIILGQKEEWREDLNAASISAIIEGKLSIPVDMSPDCPNLSTLLFRLYGFYLPKIPLEIPSSFFKQMGGLKVLQLNDPSIKQLPDIISDKVNLTALLLSGCEDLASVPPLGKLSRLRKLDLSNTKIGDIPEGLERLVNLELLYLDKTRLSSNNEMKLLPKGTFSKLQSLQELRLDDHVVVADPEVMHRLEVFYGCLSCADVYQHINFGRLNYYRIEVIEHFDCNTYEDYHPDSYDPNDAEKQLMFSYCNLHGGLNVGHVYLLPRAIKQLILFCCTGMKKCISDMFPTLSSSNKLSYLAIEKSDEVEFLLQLSSSPCRPFEKLQHLRLLGLPNFIELFNWDSKALHRHLPPGIFSSLIRLEINRCNKMRKLLTVKLLQHLQNLEELYVIECEELEEIAADDIDVGSGGGCTLFLPKLSSLLLDSLPQLKNICKETIICKSIEIIWVSDCPKVKRLPSFFPIFNEKLYLPNRFEIMGTKEWWDSLEWDNLNSKNAFDPFFRHYSAKKHSQTRKKRNKR